MVQVLKVEIRQTSTSPRLLTCERPCLLQDVKIFGEDGTCKVVEIPVDMKSRDLCQLLVYRSHCVDDNSWTLVEFHPHLGIGRGSSCAPHAATHRQTRHPCVLRLFSISPSVPFLPPSRLLGVGTKGLRPGGHPSASPPPPTCACARAHTRTRTQGRTLRAVCGSSCAGCCSARAGTSGLRHGLCWEGVRLSSSRGVSTAWRGALPGHVSPPPALGSALEGDVHGAPLHLFAHLPCPWRESHLDGVAGCRAAFRALRVRAPFSHKTLFLPERCLEDHELVAQVDSTMAGESKFLFRKNYGKYEFFKNPTVSPVSSARGWDSGSCRQHVRFLGAEQSVTGTQGSGQWAWGRCEAMHLPPCSLSAAVGLCPRCSAGRVHWPKAQQSKSCFPRVAGVTRR